MHEGAASEPRSVLLWENGTVRRVRDQLAVEEPLQIRVDTAPFVVTMRTPGHDDELAAGFLLTEGVLQKRRDLLRVAPLQRNSSGNVIDVFLRPQPAPRRKLPVRRFLSASSCGLCGKTAIEEVRRDLPKVKSRLRYRAETLLRLVPALREQQAVFNRTGGLHAAALFNSQGSLLVLREDIGRHNAVDKVVGYGLLTARLPFDRHVLLVSGRASFEIVQKALAAGIPIVASVSAPSHLAVAFARRSGQTLVGFLREHRFNIYTHPARVRLR
jgi:FdhD protein